MTRGRSARVWKLSSAHNGTGLSNPRRASSSPALSGCSIRATPKRASSGGKRWRSLRLQPSLASTMSRACGATVRTASTRSRSPAPAILSLIVRYVRSNDARRSRHRFGCIEAQRVCGSHGNGRRQPEQIGSGFARRLGFPIEQGAIDRVARRTRPQPLLKVCARQPTGNVGAERFDLGDNALYRLAIAGIRNALAAAGCAIIGDLDHDDVRHRLRAARDAEASFDRPGRDERRAISASSGGRFEPAAPVSLKDRIPNGQCA